MFYLLWFPLTLFQEGRRALWALNQAKSKSFTWSSSWNSLTRICPRRKEPSAFEEKEGKTTKSYFPGQERKWAGTFWVGHAATREGWARGGRNPRCQATQSQSATRAGWQESPKQGLWTETTRVADTPKCGALPRDPARHWREALNSSVVQLTENHAVLIT